VEGQNLTIEWRWADGSLDRFATLVDEVVRLPVDVIVVANDTAAGVAQRVTTTIPILIRGGGSIAQSVGNLAQPRGNITGFAALSRELWPKRMELLKEAVPEVTHMTVLRGLATFEGTLPVMEAAAHALGVQLQLLDVRDPTALDRALGTATRAHAALLVLGDPFFRPYYAQIAALAVKSRLPSIGIGRAYAEAGGLMSYGPNAAVQGQRLAVYVDKLLKGAKPADLPIQQPTAFELVINLKTAQTLGLSIPPTFLFQATEVLR
jgi:putative ABC transport system substrate-binding protein